MERERVASCSEARRGANNYATPVRLSTRNARSFDSDADWRSASSLRMTGVVRHETVSRSERYGHGWRGTNGARPQGSFAALRISAGGSDAAIAPQLRLGCGLVLRILAQDDRGDGTLKLRC